MTSHPTTPPERQHISSGTVWEEEVGYSRAVRVGQLVFVTGTVGADTRGNILAPDDGYAQTKHAFAKIDDALAAAGATRSDIVRTRIYITHMNHAADVGRAHKELLGDVRPATTMVVVSELWGDGSVVEIEVDAVIGT